MSDDNANPELDALKESVAKLEANNKRLTAELKEARKSAEITPEQLATVEQERDKALAELATVQKQAKDALKAAETATKQLEAETGFTQKLLIDNGLLETLGKNGVTDPAYQKAALAMLRGGVQIVIDGDNRIAKFGDKPLADHVKEWATSDEGKRFVAADANTGGGAQGGAGGGNNKVIKQADFDALAPKARASRMAEGYQVV